MIVETEIRIVEAPEEKTQIVLDILHQLPEWFAMEASVQSYAEQVRKEPFFAAYRDGKPVGFLGLLRHNPYTAEVCVMGVLRHLHREGVGSALMQAAEACAKAEGLRFLTVKTLDASARYAPYDRTRSFYKKMGFVPLEVFTTLWDEDNPCLFMAKSL